MGKTEFQGTKLKNARLFRGKTLTELATLTGISKQSISLYENGTNRPDHERVLSISQALDIPYEFFFQEDSFNTLTEATYFRALMSATKMNRTVQSIKLEYVAKLYETLVEYIDFPALNLPPIDFSGNEEDRSLDFESVATMQEIESVAIKVREYWGVGDGPVDNLQLLLEANGIIVTGFDTGEDNIDAFSQRTLLNDENMFFICLDQGDKPEGRIRFDMAHELGHILMHPWSENLELISKDEFKSRERQANMFAGAFLLPENSFVRDIRAYPTDLKYYLWLKKKWKASVAAMMYRSNQLGVITANQFQYMMRQYSKNGWRRKEPDDIPFYLNANILRGAVELLIEQKYFTPASLLRFFWERGVALNAADIEGLLYLRKGTLGEKEPKSSPVQLRLIKNS